LAHFTRQESTSRGPVNEPRLDAYLKAPRDRQTLLGLIERMGVRVRELLRRKGPPHDELGLDDPNWTDDQGRAKRFDAPLLHIAIGPGTWISTSQETSMPEHPKSGAVRSIQLFFGLRLPLLFQRRKAKAAIQKIHSWQPQRILLSHGRCLTQMPMKSCEGYSEGRPIEERSGASMLDRRFGAATIARSPRQKEMV
jgi:hypothetical protein